MLIKKTLNKMLPLIVKLKKNEVLFLDGSKVMKGNLDMDTHKIIDLGEGSRPGDAVNYSQLISHTTDHRRDSQLAPSFKFYRDFGDKGELSIVSSRIKGHDHVFYIVWVRLKVLIVVLVEKHGLL